MVRFSKITPNGTLTTLQEFDSFTDGSLPLAGLIQAANGNFYGTTPFGGTTLGINFGTVFTITPTGTLKTLYSFCFNYPTCNAGTSPQAGLIQGNDGNFYGTTTRLVTGNYPATIFKITPGGTLDTLYSFCAQQPCADGAWLALANDGNLYGTTELGGEYGYGTVFKITPTGTFTTLHNFGYTDGAYPIAALVQATDGNFYGTTMGGSGTACGSDGCGTLFRITSSGTLDTLYRFCSQANCADGLSPSSGLIQATDGNFYGATPFGGTENDGTVFELSVGLGPFVKTLPASGKVRSAVKILGTNLTGATNVTFNGVAAAFTIVRPSLITATVPTGATTGTVQVVTPTGTLSSNVVFRVR